MTVPQENLFMWIFIWGTMEDVKDDVPTKFSTVNSSLVPTLFPTESKSEYIKYLVESWEKGRKDKLSHTVEQFEWQDKDFGIYFIASGKM